MTDANRLDGRRKETFVLTEGTRVFPRAEKDIARFSLQSLSHSSLFSRLMARRRQNEVAFDEIKKRKKERNAYGSLRTSKEIT